MSEWYLFWFVMYMMYMTYISFNPSWNQNVRMSPSFWITSDYHLKHKLLYRCNQSEYAYFYSGNLKRHLKTQRKEKSHKYFLVVQISIPAVAKCLDNIRGAFRTQTFPEKNAELSLKLNSSLKNILEGNKFWKTWHIRLTNIDFVCHFHQGIASVLLGKIPPKAT